ncbi:MAG: alpha/beta hydrolase [Citrobacter freundii]|nr:MAG: alpha/beta hydrolase [Citrobacter freundii]
MNKYFIIPGLGNSGPQHWQTYFERTLPDCVRIEQAEWDAPSCAAWISTIDAALEGYDLSTVILIGHSLGCATVAHWYKQYNKKIKGAMLVAPSDLEAPGYTFPVTGFDPIPLETLPFKTIVVASTNDHWITIERAEFFADRWGSKLVNLGNAGHINAASGYGDWEEGIELLKRLG